MDRVACTARPQMATTLMSRPLRNFGDLDPLEHRDAGLSVRNAGVALNGAPRLARSRKVPRPALGSSGEREETGPRQLRGGRVSGGVVRNDPRSKIAHR